MFFFWLQKLTQFEVKKGNAAKFVNSKRHLASVGGRWGQKIRKKCAKKEKKGKKENMKKMRNRPSQIRKSSAPWFSFRSSQSPFELLINYEKGTERRKKSAKSRSGFAFWVRFFNFAFWIRFLFGFCSFLSWIWTSEKVQGLNFRRRRNIRGFFAVFSFWKWKRITVFLEHKNPNESFPIEICRQFKFIPIKFAANSNSFRLNPPFRSNSFNIEFLLKKLQ